MSALSVLAVCRERLFIDGHMLSAEQLRYHLEAIVYVLDCNVSRLEQGGSADDAAAYARAALLAKQAADALKVVVDGGSSCATSS